MSSSRIPEEKAKKGRSMVTNGRRMFPRDSKAARTRRFSDVFFLILRELGGFDRATEAQRQLARRAAMLSMECERLEAATVEGRTEFDTLAYARLSDSLGRALARLGLGRRLKDVSSPVDLDHFLGAVAQGRLQADGAVGMDAAGSEAAASAPLMTGKDRSE
jgi:hypothetical protein